MADYTRDQIYAAMRAADKAGDGEAVKALGAHLDQLSLADAEAQDRASGKTVDASKGLTGAVHDDRSLGDVLSTSAQSVGGNISQGVDAGLRMLAAPGKMVTDAIGSGIGAAGGAMLRAAGDDRTAKAFSDYFSPGDGPTLGSLVKQVTPQATPGVETAAQMLGGAMTPMPSFKMAQLAKIPAEAAANVAGDLIGLGKQAGVRVLTSDVKPPTTFIGKTAQSIGEKIPFVGTGGTRAAQQAERVEAVKNTLREFGGDDAVDLFDNAPSAVDQVAADLVKRRGDTLTKLTNAKNAVIDKFTDPVATPNAISAIDTQVARLKGINNDAYAPVIAKLESFKDQLSQGKNLRQIEGNRALLGDLFADQTLASIKGEGQKAINAIYGPLREDMGAFIKENGGQGAFSRWKGANDQLSAMAGELKNGRFKSVLNDADTTPENAAKLLFSTKPSEVSRLYDNLTPAGQSKARAAVLQRAFDKAVSADGGLSVERFVNNLKSFGSPVGVVFSGEHKAQIDGLARLLDATRRASGAAAAPPTGVQNVPVAVAGTLGSLFGNTAIPIAAMGGLLARAYESAPIRNRLVQLARTTPGSRQELTALQQVAKLLPAQGAQVSRAINDNAGPAISAAGQNPEQQGQQQGGSQP